MERLQLDSVIVDLPRLSFLDSLTFAIHLDHHLKVVSSRQQQPADLVMNQLMLLSLATVVG